MHNGSGLRTTISCCQSWVSSKWCGPIASKREVTSAWPGIYPAPQIMPTAAWWKTPSFNEYTPSVRQHQCIIQVITKADHLTFKQRDASALIYTAKIELTSGLRCSMSMYSAPEKSCCRHVPNEWPQQDSETQVCYVGLNSSGGVNSKNAHSGAWLYTKAKQKITSLRHYCIATWSAKFMGNE